MAEQTNVTADAAASGTPASNGAATGGTPGQATAEAAGQGGDINYWKTEAQNAFKKRDRAVEDYKSSDEWKALQEKAAKADQYEAAKAEAERKAAEEKGEWKRLYEETNAGIEKLKADYEARLSKANQDHAELARKHKTDRARAALSETYLAVGGIDLDAFLTLAAPHLTDGSIAIGDDGTASGHGDVVKSFLEKRGYLFRTKASDALAMLQAHGVRTETQPNTFAARDAQKAAPAPMSLTEYAAASRAKGGTNKTRFPIGGKTEGG